MGQRDQVYSGIEIAQVRFSRKFIPQPDFFEFIGIFGISLKVCLHQAFKAVTFVTLGEGDFAVFCKDLVESHIALKSEQNWLFLFMLKIVPECCHSDISLRLFKIGRKMVFKILRTCNQEFS